MPKTSQRTNRALAANIVGGIRKRLPRRETYTMNGKALSHAELIAFFQAQVDAIDAVRSARAALAAAITAERVIARRVRAQVPNFRDQLVQRFGPASEALVDFGLRAPKKPGPKTLEGKRAGAEKARATREARTGKTG
jgi:hypothetical protein